MLTVVVLKLVLEAYRGFSEAGERSRTVTVGENLGGYEALPLIVLIVKLRPKVSTRPDRPIKRIDKSHYKRVILFCFSLDAGVRSMGE